MQFTALLTVDVMALSEVRMYAPSLQHAMAAVIDYYPEHYDEWRWRLAATTVSHPTLQIREGARTPLEAIESIVKLTEVGLIQVHGTDDVMRRLTPRQTDVVVIPSSPDDGPRYDAWVTMWVPATCTFKVEAANRDDAFLAARTMLPDRQKDLRWTLLLPEAHTPELRFLKQGVNAGLGPNVVAMAELPDMNIVRRIACEETRKALQNHMRGEPQRRVSFLTMKPTADTAVPAEDDAVARAARRVRRP